MEIRTTGRSGGGVMLTDIKVTDMLMLGFYSGVKKTSGEAGAFYGRLGLSKRFSDDFGVIAALAYRASCAVSGRVPRRNWFTTI